MLLQTRVAGIDVLVDRSWLITLATVTLLTAVSARSISSHEVGVTLALFIGLAVAFGLTLSLLLHELAHARVSLKSGVRVAYIRIHAAGALCRRSDPIQQANHPFSVAAAGPIASVAIGVITLTAAFAVEVSGLSDAIAAALWFVAFANVLIAVSNMLPIFPFDGGKVLHAVIWRSIGDRQAATERVRRGGRQFSRVIVGLGIIMLGWAGELLLGLAIAGFGIYLMFLPSAD
jgi:Zn-dependent protease